ncbi:hypothetical protein [Photobacterium minamisatsumaniensis]|uniref:hypothetical protein n=1 Tax=Photobacterium minamisatsumaniensis TaxID=2910233 RepID=UPI003D14CE9E
MRYQTLKDIQSELKSLAFCSAVRHLMHHRKLARDQALKLIADHCWVSVSTVKSWQYNGVPERQVDAMLELLNTRSPWARHQLAPRKREAEIWMRVNTKDIANTNTDNDCNNMEFAA